MQYTSYHKVISMPVLDAIETWESRASRAERRTKLSAPESRRKLLLDPSRRIDGGSHAAVNSSRLRGDSLGDWASRLQSWPLGFAESLPLSSGVLRDHPAADTSFHQDHCFGPAPIELRRLAGLE